MIKLAFSTLGCPDWSFDDILSTAKDLGYDAIEIRGIGNQMHVPNTKPFRPENIEKTKARLEKLGIEIACLTSFTRLNETFRIDLHISDAKEYIDLAAALGTPYVRVIGDSGPTPTDVPFDLVADRLKELSVYAEKTNVTILVETNGAFANSQTMLNLINKVNTNNVAVLWDINHPFRNYGESAEYTFGKLKDHIRYLHIKDSVAVENGIEYQMIGNGELPIKQVVNMLKNSDFDGYLSLEWLKRWCLNLAEPGIVFPQYISYMRSLLK